MKVFAPDYYGDFKCIAGNCRHSCCIGWEIDIDDETADFYKTVPGEFGKRLAEGIEHGEDGASFRLCKNERCPFLNEKGLCDIIINLGENSLCQICDDHPRFRNFFESRTEIGLGLCCEAAAVLILDKKEKTVLEAIEDDEEEDFASEEENAFFTLRNAVFDVLQNRDLPIEKRIESMLEICGGALPQKPFAEWREVFLDLERLDESWTEELEHANGEDFYDLSMDSVAAEQLLCYFVFRHLANGFFDGRIGEMAAFIAISFYMVQEASKQVGLYEGARLYSSEIEYSDENIEVLLNEVKK